MVWNCIIRSVRWAVVWSCIRSVRWAVVWSCIRSVSAGRVAAESRRHVCVCMERQRAHGRGRHSNALARSGPAELAESCGDLGGREAQFRQKTVVVNCLQRRGETVWSWSWCPLTRTSVVVSNVGLMQHSVVVSQLGMGEAGSRAEVEVTRRSPSSTVLMKEWAEADWNHEPSHGHQTNAFTARPNGWHSD